MPDCIDFDLVRQVSGQSVLAICNRIIPGGRVLAGEHTVRNPKRLDRNPGSFRVNLRTGRWADFATGDKGGDVVSLAAYLDGCRQGEAARRLAEMLGVGGW